MKTLATVAALFLSLSSLFAADQPDLQLSLSAPDAQDLGTPFPFTVTIGNRGNATAHNVEVTIDFQPNVAVRTLPSECSSPAAGRITCHVDALEPTPVPSPFFQLPMTLVAPAERGSGALVFFGRVTESEPDLDPSTNNRTLTVTLYDTIYVTTAANDGAGSLRQAIITANANQCGSGDRLCTIAFKIEEPSPNPWKTIRVTSPLPALTSPHIRIDGSSQTGIFGDTNPDGPEIEISGGGTVDGDGLVVTSCRDTVGNLAINGFLGNGVSVIDPVTCDSQVANSTLQLLFVGTDPTGSMARPNGRGIGTSVSNGPAPSRTIVIFNSVISGNTRSGIFGLSGRLLAMYNRIGVRAHDDSPLPNGNAGIYVGPGGYASTIGDLPSSLNAPIGSGNVIAFNGQMGVAVAAGVENVDVRRNHIWGNGGLAIDIGLDGPSPAGAVPPPVLTLAHYDPASDQTVVEGDVPKPSVVSLNEHVDFYASDAPALSGAGEAQRPIGRFLAIPAGHFRFTVAGNLTGQFITATHTRFYPTGFDVIGEGTGNGELTQTSEVSAPIQVR
jgi:hypothetical protein